LSYGTTRELPRLVTDRDPPLELHFWTPEERRSQQWNDKYLELDQCLADWKPEGEESAEDVFHMKANAYEELIRLLPPSPARDNALKNYFAFLDRSWADVEDRAAWFGHARVFLREEQSDGENPAWFLEAAAQKQRLGTVSSVTIFCFDVAVGWALVPLRALHGCFVIDKGPNRRRPWSPHAGDARAIGLRLASSLAFSRLEYERNPAFDNRLAGKSYRGRHDLYLGWYPEEQ